VVDGSQAQRGQAVRNPATVPAPVPPTDQRNDVPPIADQVNPPATQTGLPRTNVPRGDQTIGTDAHMGVGPALQIGTLSVDQSGTGRMQQHVEGVQVEAVIGQAIAIYSEDARPGTNLPPALQRGVDPVARDATVQGGGASGNAAALRASGANPPARRNATVRGGGASGNIAAQGSTTPVDGPFPNPTGPNSMLPVAGGLIQQITGQQLEAFGIGRFREQPAAIQTPVVEEAAQPTSSSTVQ
jgi:hypothetical protein